MTGETQKLTEMLNNRLTHQNSSQKAITSPLLFLQDDHVTPNRSKYQANPRSPFRRVNLHHTQNLKTHLYASKSSVASVPLLQFPSNEAEVSVSDLYTDADEEKSFFRNIFSPLRPLHTEPNAFPTGHISDRKDSPNDADSSGAYHFSKDFGEGSHSHAAKVWWSLVDTLMNIYKTVDKDRLPWLSDFMDLDRMSPPANPKEAFSRLNLNVPYYALNYIELSCMVTMPFLVLYNLPFFVVYLLTCMLLYGVLVKGIETNQSHNLVCLWGFHIPYHMLGHTLLASYFAVFFFFDGVKTGLVALLINLLIVVPHALWRTPPYFDDEKLEKCRPMLVRYALMLTMLFLVYLEGDILGPSEEMLANENMCNARKERERLGITFEGDTFES